MTAVQVAIIGGGPIGLELAVALKQQGLSFRLFEAGQIGHTISWFAPQTRFFSSNERIAIAGVPLHTPDQSKATREQYLQYLRQVVQLYELQLNTYEPVVDLQGAAGQFVLTTQPRLGELCPYQARTVVLATGGTARPRMLNIPGEDLPHVSHYFEEPHKYFGRKVLIVGGRNSAIEAALRCQAVGAQVTLSYRRAQLDAQAIKYWLLPEIKSLIKSGRITAHFCSRPVEIDPGRVMLAPAEADGPLVEVEADFVLLLVGYEADMNLCRLAGVELRGPAQAPVFDPQTMLTSVPGVYVAGTLTAGSQENYRVFIENSHIHVARIVAHLKGQAPPAEVTPAPVIEMPES